MSARTGPGSRFTPQGRRKAHHPLGFLSVCAAPGTGEFIAEPAAITGTIPTERRRGLVPPRSTAAMEARARWRPGHSLYRRGDSGSAGF